MKQIERAERDRELCEAASREGAKAAAAKFDLSLSQVYAICRRRGVPIAPSRKTETEVDAYLAEELLILRRLLRGESGRTIAIEMGITHYRVQRILRIARGVGFSFGS